jgi:serine/threonine-protein kinase
MLGVILSLAGCVENRSVNASQQAGKQSKMEDPFDPDRPPTPKTLYIMSEILVAQGRDDQSEVMLKRIIEDSPEYIAAYNSLAELQMRNRRIPEAIQTLSAGLEMNPKDPVLLNNLGMCWLIRKEYALALDFFTQAGGIVPENARYRSNMATSLVLLGRREEALSLYEQILPKEEALENVQILCDSIKP